MPLEPIRFLRTTAGVAVGGFVIITAVSSAALGAFRYTIEEKRKKSGMVCRVCRGKGFYICKLCKGNATIKWSPLYDPVCINPCLCPTCDGHRVQKCLNCLGKEYW
ncbi:Heat shock protein DnaJ cysteine-rich domain superfamily [Arabidopsis suecica]|uniref:Heat shock protein DnaJ cysteine-rich domain superfamily n=1 Tax=Arabidopsis suecica TaxID=45249 RepID=A0A8T2HKN2_ARASU|nr:Heat shock protein DnaJ cysteine-rich domain superfamily [Arabidopsis suecica]